MTTKEIIKKYYKGISRKDGWQSLISDKLVFSRPGLFTLNAKDFYIKETTEFLRMVRSIKVEKLIVEDDKAFALVGYKMITPKGTKGKWDVAEILSVKDGKVDSIELLFDSAGINVYSKARVNF